MQRPVYMIHDEPIQLEQIKQILDDQHELQLSPKSQQRIRHCRNYLDEKLNGSQELFYGINTGFGSLCNIQIDQSETIRLQNHLVQSHACGMGDLVPPKVIRLILLLKIQSLSFGFSGIRQETIERLIFLYNHDLLPVIYQQGSLGASGDLAPLAHLSLPLLGLGEVYVDGVITPTSSVEQLKGWGNYKLQSKEGLALLNGTQFSTAYAVWCLLEARRLFEHSNLTAALSIDAFDCQLSPLDDRIHRIRKHQGQRQTAAILSQWLEGSEIANRPKNNVQDPYAFRCSPQVHGASLSAIKHVEQIITDEINAVTDNPNIFPDEDAILSGGNFHAQPIALALDYLAIALAELGSISERRTYQLICGNRDLPAFLTPNPGLNSGMMIPQYTAASIASQNKQFCTPASIDSIVSSNGQEDHVSMAANAGTKAYKVVENLERLIAIEFMTAAQALEFRRPLKSSPAIEKVWTAYRKLVPKLEQDRVLSTDMHTTIHFFRSLNLSST